MKTLSPARHLGFAKWIIIPGLFFVLGYSGFAQSVMQFGILAMNKYTEAELIKMRSSGYYNANGQAEYVVGVNDRDKAVALSQRLMSLPGVEKVAPTDFVDWFVVTLKVGSDEAITQIQASDFVKFAYPNRGIWLCH